MLTGRDIVIISSIDWNANWQGHQEIARRWAQAGNRVLYIENLGVRSPGLRDAARVIARAGRWARAFPHGIREVQSSLYVCSPLVLPPFGSAWRRLANRHALLPFIRLALRHLGLRPDLIMSYLPTDTAIDAIQLLKEPSALLVYYCIADFAELTPYVAAVRTTERQLIGMSDVVFAQCDELASHCRGDSARAIRVFPFGVNLDVFSNEHRNDAVTAGGSGPEGTDAAALPRPIVGYVGGLHRHFDVGLVASMAVARPDLTWLLVGPAEVDLAELTQLPNVRWIGRKPHDELPRYIRLFDVGIVPYVHSAYTMTVVPTKINEYLAMGTPVVSTDLPEVLAFNARHHVIQVASNRTADFLAAIDHALRPATATEVARRREVAVLNDWGSRLDEMSTIIERESETRHMASHARLPGQARIVVNPPM